MIRLIALVFALCLIPAVALAFPEPNGVVGPTTGCDANCHSDWQTYGGDCTTCHGDVDVPETGGDAEGFEFNNPQGPHGGYTAITGKCVVCHTVHAAPADSILLLPAPTIVGTCETCHDGTGGYGVYGAIAARGQTVGGGHSVDTTTVVPGGDALTGGDAVFGFSGPTGNLICTDCHSPHGAEVVNAFLGDRFRMRKHTYIVPSSHLLKQLPTGAATATVEYGSDWCAGCHRGRSSGGVVHNHPADSFETTTTPFNYRWVALVDYYDHSQTETGALGGISFSASHRPAGYPLYNPDTISGNRGFLMVYPRTSDQAGHAPICQQCHEDSRVVGTLAADGLSASPAWAGADAADGAYWDSGNTTWSPDTDPDWSNPQFQNFPHETLNANMLVEVNDDLCLNCHPVSQLP